MNCAPTARPFSPLHIFEWYCPLWSLRADLPVFKTIVDDLPQFFRADISRTVDEQALLFERAVNQRWYVCLPVTQGGQAILDASIAHH